MAISDDIKKELHQTYNPEGSLLRTYQLRLLDILKYFDSVCKKHNIQYFLTGGTCLGAIRHEGFIPWDDDVDVAMFRKDYDKLVEVFEETDDYALQTYKNDPHYVNTYAKIRDKKTWIFESVHTSKYKYTGAFIDVFIIEKGLPSLGKFTAYLTHLLDGCDQKDPSNVFRNIIFRVCKPLFLKSIEILQKMTRNGKKCQYMISYGSSFWNQKYYYEDISNVEYKSFENYSFPVPVNWHHFLTAIYGDYMSLPDLSNIRGELHVKDIKFIR